MFWVKTALSALLIAGSSEVAKRSTVLGALIASLPLTSVLAMVWLYAETKDKGAVAGFSMSVFWAVLVCLPMFPVLSWLLKRGVGFAPALLASCGVAVVGYWGYLASK
ncbi:MAG: DUF3147 family protein [Elusimicrobia bacterium]|nr:DUF3147 family protein [Elusimicrobiota bacterium]